MGFLGLSMVTVVLALGVMYGPKLLRRQGRGEVKGFFKPGYHPLYEAFQGNFDDGKELGAAFALFYRGKLVAEMYSGLAHAQLHRGWEKDTIAPLLYATNLLPVLSVTLMEQRGQLDTDERISRLWPEFGSNGKENLTVADVLSHRAGLAAFRRQIREDEVKDGTKMRGILEMMEPSWKRRSLHGFHYVTQGWILGEIVRRVDPLHRDVGDFFREEIGEPLEALHPEDHHICVHLGLEDEEDQKRTATTYSPGYLDLWESMAEEPTLGWTKFKQHANHRCPEDDLPGAMHDATWHNFPENRRHRIPTVNGFATARGIARLMAYLISAWNGIDARVEKLLTIDPDTEIRVPRFTNESLFRLLTPLVNGTDKVLQEETAFSLGCFVKTNPRGQPILGMPGGGGIMIMGDPINQLAWAYLPTRLSPHKINDKRYLRLEEAIYGSEIGLASDRDWTHLLKLQKEAEKKEAEARVDVRPNVERKEEL